MQEHKLAVQPRHAPANASLKMRRFQNPQEWHHLNDKLQPDRTPRIIALLGAPSAGAWGGELVIGLTGIGMMIYHIVANSIRAQQFTEIDVSYRPNLDI